MIDYFSDRENGAVARTEEVIAAVVWAAIVATVHGLINSSAFGQRFPERCDDGQAICGGDESAFGAFNRPSSSPTVPLPPFRQDPKDLKSGGQAPSRRRWRYDPIIWPCLRLAYVVLRIPVPAPCAQNAMTAEKAPKRWGRQRAGSEIGS